MVNAKDFFSGNYLKAEDCKGGELCEILDEGKIEEIQTPEGTTKAVMNIQVEVDLEGEKKEKTFTPNKSNGNILVGSFGEDTTRWIGKKFKIELTKVRVYGKVKDSIVVIPIEQI